MGSDHAPGFASTDHSASSRRVVAVVSDLLLAARISETGARAGVQVIVTSPTDAFEVCRRERPDLVVVDLEASGSLPDVVRALRRDPATAGMPVIGFYPHVRAALRDTALAEGVDRALPRSAFHARLVELLSGKPPAPPRARC